jgi:hypothetical protein
LLVVLAMGGPWTYLLFTMPMKDAGDVATAVGISAFCYGLIGFLTYVHFKSRHDFVELHERGIVYMRRGKSVALRFDAVTSMNSRVERRGVTTLHVHKIVVDGKTYTFTQMYEDIADLAAAIVAGVKEVTVERTLAAIRAGKTVEFGKLKISSKGIDKGDERLAWGEVGVIEASGDVVIVRKKGAMLSWTSESVGIAHAQALRALPGLKPDVEDSYR